MGWGIVTYVPPWGKTEMMEQVCMYVCVSKGGKKFSKAKVDK